MKNRVSFGVLVRRMRPLLFLVFAAILWLPQICRAVDEPKEDRDLPEYDEEKTWEDHLDEFHNWVFTNADSYVAHADELFAESDGPVRRMTNSTFSAEFYMEVKHDDSIELELHPSVGADVYLPNMERRLKVFANNISPDELPGKDPMKRNERIHIGASSVFDFWDVIDLQLSAGVKWRWPPVGYTDVEWKKNYDHGKWHIGPSAQGYYFTDDGFGTKGTLRADYWPTPLSLAGTTFGVKWAETTEGVEWSQTFYTGLVLSGTRDNADHIIGTRFVLNGHKSSASVMDSYRYEVQYRCPIYKNWIFFSITPKLEWEDDNDWNTVPSLMFGIDMHFGSVLH